MTSLPFQPEDVERSVLEIRELLAKLTASRAEYDFMPPAMVSHAKDYAADLSRLKRYARLVIQARVLQLLSTTFMKTWFLLDLFVNGLERANPFAPLFAARSQMELFAVVFETINTVRTNSGDHDADFVARVQRIDEVLLNATYGTRSIAVPELLRKLRPSKVRDVRDDDFETLQARNILTRITKVAKSPNYGTFLADYERLCEYLHPNMAQNMLLMAPSKRDSRFIKLSRIDPLVMQTAVTASAIPMSQAARGAIAIFDDLMPPFSG